MAIIRTASSNLFLEIVVRVFLIAIFCYMETMTPYMRVILPQELEECKYPRHDSFVPASVLYCIVLAVPFVLSLWSWAVLNDSNDAVELFLAWSLSFGLTAISTDALKLAVGRPRPDFFYRCFPDGVPTEDLQCTGNTKDIISGRVSFPSGHSSWSFCSLGFASFWLCGRLLILSRRRGSGARILLCAAPLLGAAGVAISRVADYHHHWQDILVGATLGYTISLFCYRQYYNPLSSDLCGVPYIISNGNFAKFANSKMESPDRSLNSEHEKKIESTPLLNGRKEDKWI